MDEVDHNLLDAWHRVFARCAADPGEARRRWRRTSVGATFDRPPRAWCLAVRASDARLGGIDGAVVDPGRAADRLPHGVVLDGAVLRALGGPVRLDAPGVRLTEAAARLGVHREVMRKWLPVRPGRTRAARRAFAAERSVDGRVAWVEASPGASAAPSGSGVGDARLPGSASLLHVRYEPASVFGGRGMAVPVVWSDRPMDPGFDRGAPPHPVWGTLWHHLAEGIAPGFEQVVERRPIYRRHREGPRFRGWQWVCPGRLAAGLAGGLRPGAACGRLVKKLFAPLPVWTVPRALGEEALLDLGGVGGACAGGEGGLGLAGAWQPGVVDRLAGARSLACERCWGVRWLSPMDTAGWNELVAYLSGGLLYGREVVRPAWLKPERRRAYYARPGRRAGGVAARAHNGAVGAVR